MSFAATIWSGLRAVALRPPRTGALAAGPGAFLVLIPLYLAVEIALATTAVARPWSLAPYGVTTILTDSMLTLAAAWAMMRVMQRRDIVWGVASTLLAATIATSALVHWPLEWAAGKLIVEGHVIPALLLDFASRWWWLLVLLVVAWWLAPHRLARTVLAALLGYAISAAMWWWLPSMPVLTTAAVATRAAPAVTASVPNGGTDRNDADEDTASTPAFDAEEVLYNQQDLVDAAAAKLKPQTPGVVDLYVIAFAGDGGENVFRNEAEYAERLFARRFHAEGRVIVLENNSATVATHPLATLTNLTWALDDVARTMDPAEDVLLLYITTHGSSDHELLVDLDPLPLDQIGPQDLADALKTRPGIRWKVIVVNACYSGGFIDALRDDSTMVITSARSDRTSFGCGSDSDITYFGKAFLAQALNETGSIPEAFNEARASVAEWETEDKEEHSEPQIASTRSIEAKLDAWQRTLHPGAPVAFTPAKSESCTPDQGCGRGRDER
jgi:Peptidase C13 family